MDIQEFIKYINMQPWISQNQKLILFDFEVNTLIDYVNSCPFFSDQQKKWISEDLKAIQEGREYRQTIEENEKENTEKTGMGEIV